MNKKNIIIGVLAIIIICLITFIIIDFNKKEVFNETDILIQQQQVAEKRIAKESKQKAWTISNPYITINPYGTNELSAYIVLNDADSLKYTYTVQGKTDEADFTYSSNEYEDGQIFIPVIALYANTENTVDMTYDFENGKTQSYTYKINVTDEGIDENEITADVTTKDDKKKSKIMDNNFILDNYGRLYDTNGDLRSSALANFSWYGYIKEINGKMIIPDQLGNNGLYTQAYSIDYMGKYDPDFVLNAPDGYIFHHDGTYVDGKYYMLITTYNQDDKKTTYLEDAIAVYDEQGTYLETLDFGDLDLADLQGSVAGNSHPYDIHYNSIDYDSENGDLILGSRSFSQIIAYNIESEKISYVIDDPSTVSDKYADLTLEPTGDFNFTSGNHTTFIANDYIKDAKDGNTYISVFDNNSCLDEEGNELVKGFEEDLLDNCNTGNAEILIYEIDHDKGTVSTYQEIETPSKTAFTGSTFIHDDYITTFVTSSDYFYVYDRDGNELFNYHIASEVGITELDPFAYRADIVSADTINSHLNNFS